MNLDAQGTEVGATFEISDVAVNIFLTEQYNKSSFQKTYVDNIGSFTFTATLLLPEIEFFDNIAKVHFDVRIDASNNNYDGVLTFEDDLSFSIPFPSVSDVSVVGISQAFASKVNSLSTHSEIKSGIIAAWEDLNLEVYPEKLAKRINTTWLENQSIDVVDPFFSLDIDIDPGKIKITTNTHFDTNEIFEVKAVSVGGIVYDLYTRGSKSFTVSRLEIFMLNGSTLTDFNPNDYYQKGNSSGVKIHNLAVASANYGIRILYRTSNTFHIRTFLLSIGFGTTTWVSNQLGNVKVN